MTPSESTATPAIELPTLEPRDGIPEVIDTPRGLTRVLESLQRGSGPVGVDAERASGFRYGQRAYLVQLHRTAGGTWLIDPIALPDLHRLAEALAPWEWIIHAASQDLGCLAQIGLRPTRLFDTELAGRLLGHERVGLGPLVASQLGAHLDKGHGAADWSTRPLPDSWRRYAALDVEVLPGLRDTLHAQLQAQGKWDWACEEFDALINADPPAPRVDPWRRTSGIHAIRTRRGLALVRSLWEARDRTAQERDIAPGRLLADSAIIAAAAHPPNSPEELAHISGFTRGRAAGLKRIWWEALRAGLCVPDDELPELALRGDGPPPPRQWAGRDAEAAARLAAAKVALAALSDSLHIPVENIASPDAIRRVLWTPPQPADDVAIADRLRQLGLRSWQRELVAPLIARACEHGSSPANSAM
jgi:ribonuclease D